MEADWEVEVGGEAPVIEALWSGFVDLRFSSNRVAELTEIQTLPALANALVQLNAAASPLWTSKCDVWPVDGFDRLELDAPAEAATHGIACYVDILHAPPARWGDTSEAVAFCVDLCARLRGVSLSCCRVDLVVRRALITPGANDLGITAYLTACGATEAVALGQLQVALAAFVDAVVAPAPPTQADSQLK
jgi:hypothetical protein